MDHFRRPVQSPGEWTRQDLRRAKADAARAAGRASESSPPLPGPGRTRVPWGPALSGAAPRRLMGAGRLARMGARDPGRAMQRHVTPELMDDPGLDPRELGRALDGLTRLNAWSLCAPVLWRVISSEAASAGRRIRVLDVACARGDWVVRSALRAQRRGVPAEFHGCDVNPLSIDMARRAAARDGVPCAFFVRDAIRADSLGEYDVVVASLFLHHLTDANARTLLAKMRGAAARLVVVNDLVRSRANVFLVWAASMLLSRSRVVHADAVSSVRAAYSRSELRAVAEGAGLRDAKIVFGGLGRMMLLWRKVVL